MKNVYATLAEFKNYVTSRGSETYSDYADDLVIIQLLETASRYLDSQTSRFFYPVIETRHYDLPGDDELNFDVDVLEVITLLNGDGTSIAANEYNLYPKNYSPRYSLDLKDTSNIIWSYDADGNSDAVIALTSIEGFHDRYARDGWKLAGTLGAAITDTTSLTFTMTSGHTVAIGKIYRINNELYTVSGFSGDVITIEERGGSGSTAATHINGTTVYEWHPMEEARNACIEIANNAYRRRFGQSSTVNTETVTGAGVVLSPREIPVLAKDFIDTYRRRVL